MSQAQPVSQSTDRIALQFNNFADHFTDQQSESPIKMPQKLSQSVQAASMKAFTSGKAGQVKVANRCEVHGDEVILLCLKDSEKVCARCLNSTHLLHPVVPLNSLD